MGLCWAVLFFLPPLSSPAQISNQTWYESKFNLRFGEEVVQETGVKLVEAPSGDIFLLAFNGAPPSTRDLLLAKFDKDGNLFWTQQYQVTSPSNPNLTNSAIPITAVALNSGDLLVSMWPGGTPTFVKINSSDGTIAWTKVYTGSVPSSTAWVGLKASASGGFIAARALANGFEILRADANGDPNMMIPYDVTTSIPNLIDFRMVDMVETSDGGIGVLCRTEMTGIDPGNHKMAIFKVDVNGNPTGYSYFYGLPAQATFFPTNLAALSSSTFSVIGEYQDDPALPNAQIFAFTANSSGTPVFQKIYGCNAGTLNLSDGIDPNGLSAVGNLNGRGVIVTAGVTGAMTVLEYSAPSLGVNLLGAYYGSSGRWLLTGTEGDDAVLLNRFQRLRFDFILIDQFCGFLILKHFKRLLDGNLAALLFSLADI